MARGGARVGVGEAGKARIADAHAVVERIVREERVAYGVTTGFGQLATTHMPVEQARELQENLVRSHAVGVGAPLPRDVVRAAMAIRINTLAKGHSGVRQEVVDLLCADAQRRPGALRALARVAGRLRRPGAVGAHGARHDGRG